MIKRTTWIAFFLLMLFSAAVFIEAFYPTKINESIEKMLTKELTHSQQEKQYPTKQLRKGVSKDLWISDPQTGRLHHHIECPSSILTAITHRNRIELIERMLGMKCYFQEKVEETEGGLLQQIRYLESDEGTYHYTDQEFEADAVFLALFRLPGSTLSTELNAEEAFLKGIAQEVSLSFTEGSPNFQAQKFKAHIRPQGKGK